MGGAGPRVGHRLFGQQEQRILALTRRQGDTRAQRPRRILLPGSIETGDKAQRDELAQPVRRRCFQGSGHGSIALSGRKLNQRRFERIGGFGAPARRGGHQRAFGLARALPGIDPRAQRRIDQARYRIAARLVVLRRPQIGARAFPVAAPHRVDDEYEPRVEPLLAARPQRRSRAARRDKIAGVDRPLEHFGAQTRQVGRPACERLQRNERLGGIACFLGKPGPDERVERCLIGIDRRHRSGRRSHHQGGRQRRENRSASELTYWDNWGLRRLRG